LASAKIFSLMMDASAGNSMEETKMPMYNGSACRPPTLSTACDFSMQQRIEKTPALGSSMAACVLKGCACTPISPHALTGSCCHIVVWDQQQLAAHIAIAAQMALSVGQNKTILFAKVSP